MSDSTHTDESRSARDVIGGAIRKALRDYRQTEVADEYGGGYPLVDALTLEGNGIDMGEREIDAMTDELVFATASALTASGLSIVPAVTGDVGELVKKMRVATMRFDWGDLPDDAAISAVPLLREAASTIERQAAEIERLKDEVDEHLEELGMVIMNCPPGMRTSPASEGVRAMRTKLARLEAENARLAARVSELENAARRIVPYLRWTISDESPGHHPTMGSAVREFMAVFGWPTEADWREDFINTALRTGDHADGQ